tara:strand:- start:481 stop:603 length:123 start_codon:yes stop_codon:yes gene_type:complete
MVHQRRAIGVKDFDLSVESGGNGKITETAIENFISHGKPL